MLGLHSVKQREQECPQNRTSLKNDGDGEPPELLPHRTGGVAGATGLGRFRPWGRPGRESGSPLGCVSAGLTALACQPRQHAASRKRTHGCFSRLLNCSRGSGNCYLLSQTSKQKPNMGSEQPSKSSCPAPLWGLPGATAPPAGSARVQRFTWMFNF